VRPGVDATADAIDPDHVPHRLTCVTEHGARVEEASGLDEQPERGAASISLLLAVSTAGPLDATLAVELDDDLAALADRGARPITNPARTGEVRP
jgi:hypothetical protein